MSVDTRTGTRLRISAGPFEFVGQLEEERAPRTCELFADLLPLRKQFLHVRWSGEAVWVPFDDVPGVVEPENHTSHAAPGQMLLYAAGYSEPELFLPYGGSRFASIVGQLAGNHFLTIVEGQENLRALGERTLWEGAQDVLFERLD
jgi:hypothetical protein